MKLVDKQSAFNAGIITTKLLARDDLKQFNNGVGDAFNFLCSKYGPIHKRVGTVFSCETTGTGTAVFNIPFVFSVNQSINIEIVAGKIRFYTFDGLTFGVVADPSDPTKPYEVVNTFTEDQVSQGFSYAQSLDAVYIAVPGGTTKIKVLRRIATNNWTLSDFEYSDGPYLDKNFDQTKKLKVSVTTLGTATVTATGFTFASTDVGRHIRMNFIDSSTSTLIDRWCWCVITAVASGGASCTVTMKQAAAVANTDTTEWRLGAWSATTGYPTKLTIHEQRLATAGVLDKPWVWLSNSFTYSNFSPSDYSGVTSDRNAIYYDASSDKVSNILWLKSLKSLLIGTELSEMRMYSTGGALTPADVVISKESSYGSYNSEPILSDEVVVFIQRLQRTVRAVSYDYNRDAYLGPELSVLAESLTVGGIKKIVYQREPESIIWAIKTDGSLLAITYDKEQDVVSWTRAAIAGTDVKVVDAIVLPSSTYQQDVVIFFVDRKVNGSMCRYVEVLSREFLDTLGLKDVTYLDCSTRFVLGTPSNTLTGLDHLEGETVTVMDEGAYKETCVVENGSITLTSEVTNAWVGLGYNAFFDTLERDFQDKQVSTKMSKIKVHKMVLFLIKTLGIQIKQLQNGSFVTLETFDPSSNMDTAPVPLTTQQVFRPSSAWVDEDRAYRFRIESSVGMPCMIAGVVNGIEINPL